MLKSRAPEGSWFNYNNVPDPDEDSYLGPGADYVPRQVILPLGPTDPNTDDWRPLSACIDSDIDFFDGRQQNEAKRFCRTKCPVAIQCLEFALANKEEWGVWGGLGPEDRRVILRHRRNP